MPVPLTKKEKKMLQAAADGDLGVVGSLLKQAARVADTALATAAAHGHLAIVNKLLGFGAKPLVVDDHGDTALTRASNHGYDEIVAKLLVAGATVNAVNKAGETALTLASTGGHLATVERLLTAGVDVNHANKRGVTALMDAAMYGHEQVVERLLMAGAQANAANEDGATALITASANGFSGIVNRLIVWGARVDCVSSAGETPLLEAAAFGHVDIVEILLSAGATVNTTNPRSETALMLAAGRGHEAVCHTLLRAGASQDARSVDGDSALELALRNRHLQIVTLLQDYPGVGSLAISPESVFQAVRDENEDVIRGLYGQRLEVRGQYGRTPMHLAAELGRLSILQLLIERDASVSSCDDAGATPLHVACAFGNLSAVSLLLLRGADLQAIDQNGVTPIEAAALHGHIEIVSELSSQGASLAIVSPSNSTLLHRAIVGGNSKLVMYLLDNAVIDVNAVDVRGWTALHCAVQQQDQLSAALLLKHGAKVNIVASTCDRVLGRGEAALHGAIRLVDDSIARMLLRSDDVDINLRNAEGETPLMIAVSLGRSQVAGEIIKRNARAFHERCAALTNDESAAIHIEELADLVILITSVHDLRWIVTLLSLCEDEISVDRKSKLLKSALSYVIVCKLVYDDEACVFFKLTLEHCETAGLLQRSDVLLLDRQAEKVNMESAEWVIALKKQVFTHSWQLEAHQRHLCTLGNVVHEAYVAATENRAAICDVINQVNDLRDHVEATKSLLAQVSIFSNVSGGQLDRFQRRLQQSEGMLAATPHDFYHFRDNRLDHEVRSRKTNVFCRIVARIAGFLFAPLLPESSNTIVDFADPIEIVLHVYEEPDIPRFLAHQSVAVLPPMILSQFEKHGISADEFGVLLREEIAYQHPEIVHEAYERGLGSVPYAARVGTGLEMMRTIATEKQAITQLQSDLESARKTQSSTSLRTSVTDGLPRVQSASTSGDVLLHELSIASAPEWEPLEMPNCDGDCSPFKQIRSNSVGFVDDPSCFPYHAAVQSSQGDVTIFRELISTTKPGVYDQNARMRMQLTTTSPKRETLCATEYAFALGYEAVGEAISAQMESSASLVTSRAISIRPEEELHLFPFILAVAESQGDVGECLDCYDALDKTKHSLEDRIQAIVVRDRWELVTWSVVEFASYAGYVEILKELFSSICSDAPSNTRIKAIQQARRGMAT